MTEKMSKRKETMNVWMNRCVLEHNEAKRGEEAMKGYRALDLDNEDEREKLCKRVSETSVADECRRC